MNAPAAFVVELDRDSMPGETLHGLPFPRWDIDSRTVEDLWLPKLGPTSWALLRLLGRAFDHDVNEMRYVTAAVGSTLGTSPMRCWASLQRLLRFRMLYAAAEPADLVDREARWAEPRYVLHPTVRSLTPSDWQRLPIVVRDRFPDHAPGVRAAAG